MLSAKWGPFCLSLNLLKQNHGIHMGESQLSIHGSVSGRQLDEPMGFSGGPEQQ